MRCFLLVFVVCAVLAGITPPAHGDQFITVEQAKQAVRQFEGDPNLQFAEPIRLKHDTSGPAWSHQSWYELSSTDRKSMWFVDARTGEVTYAYYDREYPEVWWDRPPAGSLSKEQCRQIAEQFARAKYRGFDQMNLELVGEEFNLSGWVFEWREKKALGMIAINGVEVQVNPVTGHIQRYSSDRLGSSLPPQTPQVSREQAIEIAKQALGIVEVDWVEEPELLTDPMGEVYWSFALGGGDAQGKYTGYAIVIDAVSGQVFDKAPQVGSAPPAKIRPPSLRPVRKRWLPVGEGFVVLLAGAGAGMWYLLRRVLLHKGHGRVR